jgi:EAL domain-containing protein (putative c-di-GMP-specific phosphodiesterase class I)
VCRSTGDSAIVQAIISLGHALGLRVVAEGVSEPGQLDFLIKHGCDEIQGYLFSRPLPFEDMRRLLKAPHTLSGLTRNG